MSVRLTFTDEQHRRLLSLVRTQAIIEQDGPEGTVWDEAVELLEVDKPPSNVVALCSRRAPRDPLHEAEVLNTFLDRLERR